jgi:hypothetical protein
VLTDLTVDETGLVFAAAAEDLLRTVDVLLDGRRIWSFRVADAIARPDATEPAAPRYRMPWPQVVLPYLDGRSTVALHPVDGRDAPTSTTARFGAADHPVRFEDTHGLGLMVNKWGALGHALADYPAGIEARLLDRVDRVRQVIDAAIDVDVYVTGGTLLGPYRDGRVIPNDDDADLAYLSRRHHPVEVAREGFALGRAVAAAGIPVLRLSAGHLQLHFEHAGRPDGYVDIFTGWIDEAGWWYQPFPVRAQVRREQLVPPGTLEVEGHPEPVCREPEVMLEALYGPGWRVPDPAFSFDIPRTTQDRFYGWLSDQHMDREPWEDHYRYDVRGNRAELGTEPTGYARAVADQVAPGTTIVELGCGRGHDALWFAQRGHRVHALDYVRWPVLRAAEAAAQRELDASFRTLNLYDQRRVLALGAELAARGEPTVVYARDLLATLWDVGRPTLHRLLSMLLRRGGEAHLDVPRTSLRPDPSRGGVLHRSVDLDVLAAEMALHGLVVRDTTEVVEEVEWPGGPQQPAAPGTTADGSATDGTSTRLEKTRMVVTWQRRR